MNIVVGTDHRGFMHKEFIKEAMMLPGMPTCLDVGTCTPERTDYPEYAVRVCQALRNKTADRGILLCGSGVGMAIVANRFRGIYAAIAWNEEVARCAARDDNTNVLVLPSDFVTPQESVAIITAWLSASFKGGRYQQRIDQIDALGGL